MKVLIYKQKIDDKKHNITFDKDKLSYRGKTFDAVISKDCRPLIDSALVSGLKYPLELELNDSDYFTKFVSYTRNDGTKGTKFKIVITGIREISQGEFPSKSLDEVVDDLEEEYSAETED